jgi:Lrp/AsnC family transcriptional regulator
MAAIDTGQLPGAAPPLPKRAAGAFCCSTKEIPSHYAATMCRPARRRVSRTREASLDSIDLKILALLQQDATLSIATIGEKVGLSQTPCWKRIQRLEADGVIDRRVAVLDPVKLGLGLTVFVSIETADHSREWLERFAETVSAMPEVLEFYRMAGDVDYMLRVVVADMRAYDTFYKHLIATLPLKNVTSRFAMEKVKSTTALPLPAPLANGRFTPTLSVVAGE